MVALHFIHRVIIMPKIQYFNFNIKMSMKHPREFPGQIYTSYSQSYSTIDNNERCELRKNGYIRGLTPKNTSQHGNGCLSKQTRSLSTVSVGKIVNKSATPRNSTQSARKENGRCYSTSKKLKAKKSIQIQTQEVLNCLAEDPAPFKATTNTCINNRDYPSDLLSKRNILGNFNSCSNNKNIPPKRNILTTADKNMFGGWSQSQKSKLYNTNEKMTAKSIFQSNKPKEEIYPTKQLKTTKTLCLQSNKTDEGLSSMKENELKINRPENGATKREVKLKNLNQKYQKNLSKYEEHRAILQDLLKAEGINRMEGHQFK